MFFRISKIQQLALDQLVIIDCKISSGRLSVIIMLVTDILSLSPTRFVIEIRQEHRCHYIVCCRKLYQMNNDLNFHETVEITQTIDSGQIWSKT